MLRNDTQQAVNWRPISRKWFPTCYEMAPNKLRNGAQCYFSIFLQVIYIYVFSVCILLAYFTISHFNKSSPTLLQVLQSLS